ncbi:MAG: sulfatase [Deltaproteobacteria bacterium]|nr:sulfatase [Deltaproteobacteria bacterium]
MDSSTPAVVRPQAAWPVLTAFVLCLALMALIEAAVAGDRHPVGAGGFFAVTALSLEAAWKYFAPALGFAVIVSLLQQLPSRGAWTYLRGSLIAGACFAVAGSFYAVLTMYPPFRGYLPFVVAYLGFALGLIAYAVAWSLGMPRTAWRLPVAASLIGTAVALHVANYKVYVGQYPTLHLSTLQIEYTVLSLGVALALAGGAAGRLRALGLGCLAFSLLSPLGNWASRSVRAGFVDATVLGQSSVVFSPIVENRHGGGAMDEAGDERFRANAGFPALPTDFVLEDYNILLIASEATRYDKTTLFDPRLKTTPNLANRARTAWSASRAYAPSSGTLHSMSALLAMKYPSMLSMETWAQPWCGMLHASEETAPELLAREGYETFWVGHNHNAGFSSGILGLDQGFDDVQLVDDPRLNPNPHTDAQIADKAIEMLQTKSETGNRFFGWVFFVSPHGPYLSHDFDDLPGEGQLDKYAQEVRYVDDQIERVFETLERTGLADNTIVIYLSDHGEEFREHGGVTHKTTVYEESVHVPLVVWLPGLEGTGEKPLSTAHLFTWLFSSARSSDLRQAYLDRVQRFFGPVLRNLDNAVLVELIGHDRMRTSLVLQDYKVDYDLNSGLLEVYASADRLEQNNLYGNGALDASAESLIESYLKLRSATARYVIKPSKTRPGRGPSPNRRSSR